MYKLLNLEDEGFLVDPVYFRQKISSERRCFLRGEIVKRLKKAESNLPLGYRFKIFDGFRVLSVQKILFDDYYKRLSKKHPDWEHEQLFEATQEFVCAPSHDPKKPSFHNTGAAVDLTIIDLHGNEIEMGTLFDEFTSRAHTDYFKNKDPQIHKNRMMLKTAMDKAGFVNFPHEWWHYSYGDRMWAEKLGKKKPIYGSIELANSKYQNPNNF